MPPHCLLALGAWASRKARQQLQCLIARAGASGPSLYVSSGLNARPNFPPRRPFASTSPEKLNPRPLEAECPPNLSTAMGETQWSKSATALQQLPAAGLACSKHAEATVWLSAKIKGRKKWGQQISLQAALMRPSYAPFPSPGFSVPTIGSSEKGVAAKGGTSFCT